MVLDHVDSLGTETIATTDPRRIATGKAEAVPLVVKADGLAAGKGVVVCHKREDALDAIRRIADEREFGDAGNKIIIEERLDGDEVSLICITDGRTIVTLPAAQDHKPAFDGDKGPNTGGMGAYCPTPLFDESMLANVTERTREIGLRKAVGARKCDILWQFLTEAVMLSMFGGIIGIMLGATGAATATYFLRDEGFEAVITAGAVILATLFSAAVGLFFGIYPAQRAAALNPIDALRYE